MLEVLIGVLTILGAIVGALISHYINKQSQERAWKREYALRLVEEVYSVLFNSLRRITSSLERKIYYHVSFVEWYGMKEDYRYFMVDKKFRAKLDDFFEKMEGYGTAVIRLRQTILPEILNEETERVFNVQAEKHATLEVKYKRRRDVIATSPRIVDCLISRTHPKEDVLAESPESSVIECFVNFRQRDGKPFHSHDVAKFDEFWESCLERMKSNETYQFVIGENDRLLDEARNLEKEIIKRIEEPWKI